MKLRVTHEGDLGAMLRIDPRAASGDPDRRAYLTKAVDHDVCLVASDGDDDELSGFVVIKPAHFFGRDFVDLLMVAAPHRRRGIGTALMRKAVATATSLVVFTSTNESNVPMQALLRAEEWRFSGKLNGLDEGDPELVYYINRSACDSSTDASIESGAGRGRPAGPPAGRAPAAAKPPLLKE